MNKRARLYSVNNYLRVRNWLYIFIFFCVASGCRVYSFRDVSIPSEVKTINLGFIENRARYINPQLSPQLTDKLKQKINNQTRLVQVPTEDADYVVKAYVSDYSVTTSGVANQQAATNRLTVTVHITFKNRLSVGTKDFEGDVSRNFEFPSTLTLADAEQQKTSDIINNVTDEMFNRIFSSW